MTAKTTPKPPKAEKAKPADELGRADPAAESAAVTLPAESAAPAVLLLDAQVSGAQSDDTPPADSLAATEQAPTDAPAGDADAGLQSDSEGHAEIDVSGQILAPAGGLVGDLASGPAMITGEAIISGQLIGIDPAAGDDDAALLIRDPSQGLLDVLSERKRQIEVKGYSAEADGEYTNHQLAKASACYLSHAAGFAPARAARDWPWPKPMRVTETRREMLVKGAALALAELERYDLAMLAAE